MFSRLRANFVLHSDYFLRDSIHVCAHTGVGGRGAVEGSVFVQELRQIHRVKKGNLAGAVYVRGTTILLHNNQERVLQLQKLLNLRRNFSCNRPPPANFQPQKTLRVSN